MYRSSSSSYDDSMNDNWMHRDVSSLHSYDRNRYEPQRFENQSLQGPSSMMRDSRAPYHTESWRRAPYGNSDGRFQDANSPGARHHPYDYYSNDPRYHQDYSQSTFVHRDLPPVGSQYHSSRPPHNYSLNRLNDPNQFQRRFKEDYRFNRNQKFDIRRGGFKNRKDKQPKRDDRDYVSNPNACEVDNSNPSLSKDVNHHGALNDGSSYSAANEALMNESSSDMNQDGYASNSCGEATAFNGMIETKNCSDSFVKKQYNYSEKHKSDTKSQALDQHNTSFTKDERKQDFDDDISLNGSDMSELDADWKEIIDLLDGKIKPSDIISPGNRLSNEKRDMDRTY